MLNVAIAEATAYESDFFKKRLAGKTINLTISDQPITVTNAKEFAQATILIIFIRSRITKEILEKLPSLKLIITRSTGYDHIDVAAACARGITICNTPIYATSAVAEYTMCLMMSLIRKMPEAAKNRGVDIGTLQGIEVKDKILGVVGTGRIGKQVIALGRCFGMKAIAYDIKPDMEYAKTHNFEYVSYDKLLATADVISFHVILTPETTHLFNLKSLSTLKKGSYIINTARGQVIDSDALVKGLQQKIIAGAALDVLSEEDLTSAFMCSRADIAIDTLPEAQMRVLLNNLYLMHHPSVIITPHVAFNTCEAQQRQLQTTVEIVEGWQNNKVTNQIPC